MVRKYILEDLNKIMSPSYRFNEILCQHIEATNQWEVYFGTENHGYVALSQSGSGLKTVLHLLSLIHLKLKVRDKSVNDGIFLFEELENSLHPRMQRNLYQYIRERFSENAVCVFSTHSPIAIDYFQADDEASIYEVNQAGGLTKCRRISAFDDRVGALGSLGVKASDALQSNFVIWVEGPTDRIYLKNGLNLSLVMILLREEISS